MVSLTTDPNTPSSIHLDPASRAAMLAAAEAGQAGADYPEARAAAQEAAEAAFIPTPTDLVRYRLTCYLAPLGVPEVLDPETEQERIFATAEGAEQMGHDLVLHGNVARYTVEVDGPATLAAANAYWKAREHQALVAIEDARRDVEALMPAAEDLRRRLTEAEQAADGLRQTVKSYASIEGGFWRIEAEMNEYGALRVQAAHFPTGEVREAATSEGIAGALLQLGNTIAQDWGHPLVAAGGLDEATEQALRGIREEVDYLRRQVDDGEEYAGLAYDAAESLSGVLGDIQEPLEKAQNQAGDAQEAFREAGGAVARIEELLGRIEED